MLFRSTNVEERKLATAKVQVICDEFDVMRNNLELVYSQTRFMKQPEGFISDHNHHNHLSAKTNSSDWLYYYELPMIKKVKHWLNQ